MWETMEANNGIGLAANQIGLPLSMVVMKGPNGRINLVNPNIFGKSRLLANLKEGCLSAPGDFILVPDRVEWVQVNYQDEKGHEKMAVFKGLYSVCIQHELEHLDGKSFMENKSIPKNIRKGLQKKWGL
jgi:peptide deformylase